MQITNARQKVTKTQVQKMQKKQTFWDAQQPCSRKWKWDRPIAVITRMIALRTRGIVRMLSPVPPKAGNRLWCKCQMPSQSTIWKTLTCLDFSAKVHLVVSTSLNWRMACQVTFHPGLSLPWKLCPRKTITNWSTGWKKGKCSRWVTTPLSSNCS